MRETLADTPNATALARSITDSAGGAIAGYADRTETAFVADAARAAMTHGITLGGYIAAGFLVIGLMATALIPATSTPSDATALGVRAGAPNESEHR